MNAQDLKNSILQLAVQGKLVEQRPEEGTAKELLAKIKAEKEQLIKDKKIKKEKPLPEITDEEKPFDIPESWEWVRLSDVVEIIMGQSPKGIEVMDGGGGIEFHQGKVYFGSDYLDISPQMTIKPTKIVKPDTVLLCVRAPVGTANITNRKICIGRGLCGIIGYGDIESRFILYWIRAFKNDFIRKATGTTFIAITGEVVREQVIPLPPLEEQKRIVSKIEELLPYIEQYDNAYTKLETFNKKFPEDMKKSILQYAIRGRLVEQRPEEGNAEDLYKQIVEEKAKLIKEGKIKKEKPLPKITEEEIPFDIPETWEWVRLSDVVYIIMGQSPKGTDVFEGREGIEFHQGKVFFGESYLRESLQKTINPTKIVDENTLLLCVRAPVGIVNITPRKICIGRGLCGLVPYNKMQSKFFLYWLRAIKNDLIKKATGTTFVAITGEVVREQLIPLPPLEEQKRIVARLEEILPYCNQLVK